MKVFLRRSSDNSFFAGSLQWTASPSAALDFETIYRAVKFALAVPVAGMQVVCKYEDSSCDTTIELQGPCENPTHLVLQKKSGSELPTPYVDVVVITTQGRSLGHLDSKGKWHGAREKLCGDVIGWEPI